MTTTSEVLPGLTMTVRPTDRNPLMERDGITMHHWRCTLRYRGQRMQVTFSKGSGHHGAEPTAAEVLECLVLDASGYDNAGNFENWCSEYGYDTDSRKALATYRAVERQAVGLRRLLGDEYSSTIYRQWD